MLTKDIRLNILNKILYLPFHFYQVLPPTRVGGHDLCPQTHSLTQQGLYYVDSAQTFSCFYNIWYWKVRSDR